MIVFMTMMAVAMVASVGIPIERGVVEEDSHTGKGKRWVGEAVQLL